MDTESIEANMLVEFELYSRIAGRWYTSKEVLQKGLPGDPRFKGMDLSSIMNFTVSNQENFDAVAKDLFGTTEPVNQLPQDCSKKNRAVFENLPRAAFKTLTQLQELSKQFREATDEERDVMAAGAMFEQSFSPLYPKLNAFGRDKVRAIYGLVRNDEQVAQ